jgi:hypothetical protein
MVMMVKTLSPSNNGRCGISGSVTTYVIMDRVERNLKPSRGDDFTGMYQNWLLRENTTSSGKLEVGGLALPLLSFQFDLDCYHSIGIIGYSVRPNIRAINIEPS